MRTDYSDEDFPKHALYVRHDNRIYFIGDPEDGDKLEYHGRCEKSQSNAYGYRWYLSKNRLVLVHRNDILPLDK